MKRRNNSALHARSVVADVGPQAAWTAPLRVEPRSHERGHGHSASFAFTLIELLMVISIIGLLAGLLVGLGPLASRKMKESRVRAELNRLVTGIEAYKADIGSYPPDNPGQPNKPPLYYELSGAIFTNGNFQTLNRLETIAPSVLKTYFGREGIMNSARNDPKEVKFSMDFKPSQYKEMEVKEDVELLIVPAKGPNQIKGRDGSNVIDINPWRYDASSTNRHNRNSFDLWAEILIGKRTNIIGNWKQ
ncbi:MAG: prepilin-type N-terminal cleavage/methylation domain-containing protein [Verrucomicrobiota bacterium]